MKNTGKPRRKAPNKRIRNVCAAAFAVGVALFLFYVLVDPLTHRVAGSTARRIADAEKRAAALNAVRQSLLVGAAGLVATIGLIFTGGTYFLARRGQIAERYLKAIALLASDDKVDERIGGIYALEHIVHDAPAELETVVQVLAAFVKRRSPVIESDDLPPGVTHKCDSQRMKPDVQAALRVLARQSYPRDFQLELSYTNLAQSDVASANFKNADLSGSCLRRADLQGADMRNASLLGACLREANLRSCRLGGAVAVEADFREATLCDAELGDFAMGKVRRN